MSVFVSKPKRGNERTLALLGLEKVKGSTLGNEEDGTELKLTLNREVLDRKVVFPVVGERLVECTVLLGRDVVGISGPDGLLLVELLRRCVSTCSCWHLNCAECAASQLVAPTSSSILDSLTFFVLGFFSSSSSTSSTFAFCSSSSLDSSASSSGTSFSVSLRVCKKMGCANPLVQGSNAF